MISFKREKSHQMGFSDLFWNLMGLVAIEI